MASATAQATFAFGAGIATFFSPCVYALLPGYIGYYVANVEGDSAPVSGALSRGFAASIGAIASFGVLAIIAVAAGATLERVLPVLEPLIGLTLIALGVLVLWKGALSLRITLPERRSSILGFGVFGAVYALAATACVLPLFLSVAILSVDLSPGGTVLVLGAYAGSFAVLMISATVATAVGQEAFLQRFRPHANTLTRVAGGVLIVAGLIQLYIAFWVAPVQPLFVAGI
jgi:cytochrome c-type biogenesis protein